MLIFNPAKCFVWRLYRRRQRVSVLSGALQTCFCWMCSSFEWKIFDGHCYSEPNRHIIITTCVTETPSLSQAYLMLMNILTPMQLLGARLAREKCVLSRLISIQLYYSYTVEKHSKTFWKTQILKRKKKSPILQNIHICNGLFRERSSIT